MHTGGEARRGKTSNDLIEIVVPEADYVVVVAAGNKDKLFNTLGGRSGTCPWWRSRRWRTPASAVKAVFKQ